MTTFLVTVGTGSFNSLVNLFDNSSVECFIQYGSGHPPTNKPSIDFQNDFLNFVQDFDYVVTHCGAGTVFQLLKLNVKLIVTPNFERNDNHQKELFNYLVVNRFCVGMSLEELRREIESLPSFVNQFEKDVGIARYAQPQFNLAQLEKLLIGL